VSVIVLTHGTEGGPINGNNSINVMQAMYNIYIDQMVSLVSATLTPSNASRATSVRVFAPHIFTHTRFLLRQPASRVLFSDLFDANSQMGRFAVP